MINSNVYSKGAQLVEFCIKFFLRAPNSIVTQKVFSKATHLVELHQMFFKGVHLLKYLKVRKILLG